MKTLLISLILSVLYAPISPISSTTYEKTGLPQCVDFVEVTEDLPFRFELPEKWYEALAMIESSGGKFVKGDKRNGKYMALGTYQIWEVYLKDSGLNYSHLDMLDDAKAKQVVNKVSRKYAKRFKRINNRWPTVYESARMHNGGPNGYKKPATLKYIKKFKKVYNKL